MPGERSLVRRFRSHRCRRASSRPRCIRKRRRMRWRCMIQVSKLGYPTEDSRSRRPDPQGAHYKMIAKAPRWQATPIRIDDTGLPVTEARIVGAGGRCSPAPDVYNTDPTPKSFNRTRNRSAMQLRMAVTLASRRARREYSAQGQDVEMRVGQCFQL